MMTRIVFIVFAGIALYGCHGYDYPLDVRAEILNQMQGDYRITLFKNQDTTINNFCTFTLTNENLDAADPFPKIYFDNILSKHSTIFQYFCIAYCLDIPPDYSGRSYIYWEPDVYEKRINLWAIAGLQDLHKVVNRKIISNKEEKWWLVTQAGLEEIYIKKL
ncbi:MAG: hypothetical protein N2167_00050 [Flavobacteriales bacterium]|nr:hypothetical protein [Flavobacteriales bacterium]